MTQVPSPQMQPTVVRSPCTYDAVGSALRDAYLRNAQLPEEITVLLHQLNDNDAMPGR